MRSRKNQPWTAAAVADQAYVILQQSLRLVDHGPKCTVNVLLMVLIYAAARVSSLYDACRRLRDAPCDQAVRNALFGLLPKQMSTLQQRLNDALAKQLPMGLFRKARPLAIDLHDDPYYGRPYRMTRELCRSKRHRGTSRFHRYATLSVLQRGRRYTIAALYVQANDPTDKLVRQLLEQARGLGLKIRYLLLDRGFYSVPVVQYLQSIHCRFVMPVVHRGRRPSKSRPEQLAGTRRFLTRRRSGLDRHQMKNRVASANVRVAIVCCRDRNGKRQPPRVFAFWGFSPPSARAVAQIYRQRFGIESSYRQLNQARARTSCRRPHLRLLLVVLALLLRNLWVWLHERVLGTARGKGIQLRLSLLRFRALLLLLQGRAEEVLVRAEPPSFPIACPVRLT